MDMARVSTGDGEMREYLAFVAAAVMTIGFLFFVWVGVRLVEYHLRCVG
jgi:hypothetical protein